MGKRKKGPPPLPVAPPLADARACLAHIEGGQGCRITAERSGLMAKPAARKPKVPKPRQAEGAEQGVIEPVCEINRKELRLHLARVVHPDDLTRAVNRVVKVNGLRPLRPASQACSGKSILELLWEELDRIVERIMADAGDEDDKGRALGTAYSIAVIQNPYRPNIEAVRREAMERWEADQ